MDFTHLIGTPVSELPTPSVLVERERLHRNISRMARTMSDFGVALRPHWKTTKCVEIAQLQVEAGAVGLTAATADEVQALVDGGITEIFWAYPPVGRHRIRQTIATATRAKLIVGADSVESLLPLSAAAVDSGLSIAFRLEVDTGLGRTGVKPEDVVTAAQALARLPGLHLDGLYTHEGQVQGAGADPQKRLESGLAAGRLIVEAADAVRQAGIELSSVSVGSTAGVMSAPSVSGVTEARPGTYVYGDENQVAIGTLGETDCAMTLISRVISVQRPDVVLIDAGIKAMSSDGSLHGDGRIGTTVGEDGTADGGRVATGNEEHGYLKDSTGLRVGDLVRIRPNHACGLSNMHSQIYLIDNDVVVDVWRVRARY